jgi:hypothetical protein
LFLSKLEIGFSDSFSHLAKVSLVLLTEHHAMKAIGGVEV